MAGIQECAECPEGEVLGFAQDLKGRTRTISGLMVFGALSTNATQDTPAESRLQNGWPSQD